MTNDEQEWFAKFQNGTFMVKGWQHRIRELLVSIPEPEKETVRTALNALGDKIGREWAKDNRIRKINTAMLQKWGEELAASARDGHRTLSEKIGDIEAQVNNILT